MSCLPMWGGGEVPRTEPAPAGRRQQLTCTQHQQDGAHIKKFHQNLPMHTQNKPMHQHSLLATEQRTPRFLAQNNKNHKGGENEDTVVFA